MCFLPSKHDCVTGKQILNFVLSVCALNVRKTQTVDSTYILDTNCPSYECKVHLK